MHLGMLSQSFLKSVPDFYSPLYAGGRVTTCSTMPAQLPAVISPSDSSWDVSWDTSVTCDSGSFALRDCWTTAADVSEMHLKRLSRLVTGTRVQFVVMVLKGKPNIPSALTSSSLQNSKRDRITGCSLWARRSLPDQGRTSRRFASNRICKQLSFLPKED